MAYTVSTTDTACGVTRGCLKVFCLTAGVSVTLLFGMQPKAAAASFDCVKGKTQIEQLICSESTLSKADEELSTAYKQLLAHAAPNIQKELRESQRNWLTFLKDGVAAIDKERDAHFIYKPNGEPLLINAQPGRPPEELKRIKTDWLREQFVARKSFLEQTQRREGDLLFYVIRLYKALPLIAPAVVWNSIQSRQSEFLQISHPQNESELQFNEAIRSLPKVELALDSEDANSQTSEEIMSIKVTQDLIEIAKLSGDYSGGVHGYNSTTTFIWLRKSGHKLEPKDVFDEKKAWSKALNTLAMAIISKDYERDKAIDCKIEFADATRWSITDVGLEIGGRPYDCGSYMGSPSPVVPWSDLKPYLSENVPFSIPSKVP